MTGRLAGFFLSKLTKVMYALKPPLRCASLPDPNDRDAVAAFARTFNAYLYHGGVPQARQVRRGKRSLVQVRTELFLAYRAGNHAGDPNLVVRRYRELLPHFRELLKCKDRA